MLRKNIVFSFVAMLTIGAARLPAGIIDSINPSASTPTNVNESVTWASNGQGWYYTPAFSYSLTGISTNFGPSFGPLVTPTITVQVQTDRPVNGGTVLAEGTFQGNSSIGGIEGTTFAPINLVAGHTYFVDFENTLGMGDNIGLWQNVGGVPTPSNGATTNLGTLYVDGSPTTGFATSFGSGAYTTAHGSDGFPLEMISGAEPILFFSGTRQIALTPEPSSIVLAAIALGGLFAFRRRKV